MKNIETSVGEVVKWNPNDFDVVRQQDILYDQYLYAQFGYMLAGIEVNRQMVKAGLSVDAFDENNPNYSVIHRINRINQGRDKVHAWKTNASKASSISIKMKKNGGAKVFLPVYNEFLLLIFMTNDQYDYERIDYHRRLYKLFRSMFGKNVFDIDKGVTYTFKPDFNLLWKIPNITKETIHRNNKIVDMFANSIINIHIVSPAATPVQAQRKIRNEQDLEKRIKEQNYTENGAQSERIRFYSNIMETARRFNVFVEIELSHKFLQYAVQSLVPRLQHIHQHLVACMKISCEDQKKWYGSFNTVQHIKSDNSTKFAGIARTNKDGLSLDTNGGILWIPSVDNTDKFDKTYLDAGGESHPEMGWSLSSSFKTINSSDSYPERKVQSKVIYYDQRNSKLVYTRNGSITVFDIENCLPLMPQHITSFLNSNISERSIDESLNRFNSSAIFNMTNPQIMDNIEDTDFKEIFIQNRDIPIYEDWGYTSETIKMSIAYAIKNGTYLQQVHIAAARIKGYLQTQESRGNFSPSKEQEWYHDKFSGDLFSDITFADLINPPIGLLRPFAKVLVKASNSITKDPIEFLESYGIVSGMYMLGVAFIVKKYSKANAMEKLQEESIKYYDKIKPVTPNDKWNAPALSGANSSFEYLPHQGGIHQKIAKTPDFLLLAADPGAGKTAIAITKIIQSYDEGIIKRALIVCPSYLIGNYVDDNLMITNGRWNIFPITRQTTERTRSYDIIEDTIKKAKAAPPNTIFITDYNFLSGGKYDFTYATSTISRYKNSDYLEEMKFDMVIVDESHLLKNQNTQRVAAANRLLASIPRRYLMSGTIIHKDPMDLISQMSLLDPTIFGSTENFISTYAVSMRRNHPQFQSGAQERMQEKMRGRISYIQVRKKEWASLLPEREERFHEAKLSTKQRNVYESVLQEVLDRIQSDSDLMRKIRAQEDEDSDSVGAILNPYLARLEQMMTAPGNDMLGQHLIGNDLVSPKIKIIADIIKDHLNKKIPGKIMVLTNYYASRDAIYDNLPAKLKQQAIKYDVKDKSRHITQFARDDGIKILIGIQDSLKIGHNLQFVSRMIRVEGVWNPGDLDQSESRIFRPDVNNKYGIKKKYIDWILCSGTIDVTKAARLMSRVMTKLKFDEARNPIYEDLPDVELISMSLKNIQSSNDFEADLSEHITAYKKYLEAVKKDYIEHAKHENTLRNNFPVKTIKQAPNTKFIMDIPYIDGQVLPYENELDIQNAQAYASVNGMEISDLDLLDQYVHTEYGDGKVIRNNIRSVRVEIIGKDGKKSNISVPKGRVFVFLSGKYKPKKKNIKEKMVKQLRMQPTTLSTAQVGGDGFNIYAYSINNQICISFDPDDPDTPDDSKIKSEGFEFVGPYVWADIYSRVKMQNLYDFVNKSINKGDIKLPKRLKKDMDKTYETMMESPSRALFLDMLKTEDMRNFWLMRRKVPKDPKIIHLYFVVEEEKLYAFVDLSVARRGEKFIAKNIPGIKWYNDAGSWTKFFKSKEEAWAFAKQLAKKHDVRRLEDFKKELDNINIRRQKK